MATGVGMNALGHDPDPMVGLEDQLSGFRYTSLDELLVSSDVVTPPQCPRRYQLLYWLSPGVPTAICRVTIKN